MPAKFSQSDKVDLRSVEEPMLDEIRRRQNEDCRLEISDMLDFHTPWAPMSLAQVKAKIEEMGKEPRNIVSALMSKDGKFVGLGSYSASWDTWSPGAGFVIWPEFRGKGYGKETARLLMRECFKRSHAHTMSCYANDWDKASISFIESLGFKKAGAMRRVGVRDGKFFDGLMFDMLRSEYFRRHA
ncbi:MAG: GNAT family N-acetyltransferase [Euryarchaeota archaeon]|nr:GNAT family N-acetyltransferase [Euryarchaeota archaeon]